ncbi:MAG TPA: lamin tail domain-containing protein [Fibrobacteria bacterium]|nr:lamin tail domain-containing protein [Fibrobacteria bacterium]
MSFQEVKFLSEISSPRGLSAKVKSAAFLAALAGGFFACVGGPDAGSGGGGGVAVELQVLPAALAKSEAVRPIDSIHVRVSAPDMDTARFGFSGSPQSVSLLDLPPGAARTFSVRLFRGGRLLYAGESVAALTSAGKNNVTVNCLPEFSRLTASVHIPTDFPKAVSGGTLRLWGGGDTLTVAASVNGELRNFRLEEVPGDRDYAVSIVLWGAKGDTLAKAFKSDLRVPKGQSAALVLPLTLAFTQLSLSMSVAEPRSTSLVLALPGGRRTPSAFGDAVFSEAYPIPTAEEGGDNGEWLELFNRSADTLDVSGCQVLRDAGTSASMVAAVPSGTTIAPGRTLVMGKAGASFAQVVIGASALSLTNTSARLAFSCASGATLVDTLRYSTSTTDTVAARIQTGKVASLRPSRVASRNSMDAWCLSATVPASGEFAATPGAFEGGCGE